jgi:hypothetical protein
MQELRFGRFHVEMLRGLPGLSRLEIRQFARPGQSTHSEGTVVSISGPLGSWIGNFQSGRYPSGLTDVVAFQDEPSVCVFAGGQGYSSRLDSDAYRVLEIFPVFGVRYIRERDWIILWDFTKFEAHSANGIVWRSKRVSWDGISVTEIRSDYLNGFGRDAVNDTDVEFTINLLTGEHTGGPKNLDGL